ncbi:MAG: ABC transporter ATP-binding protein [Albidovulum sp.]|nr:ABC transporter ATP-binding protein [Albidovulum sp.]
MPLLDVSELEISVHSTGGDIAVVKGVSFQVNKSGTIGIVGESGCGKSLTSLAIMGLLDGSQARTTGGTVRFEGTELLGLTMRERRKIMGNQMSMIFQEPMTSLNPVYRVGDQIAEALRQHRSLTRKAARERAIELLRMVRIPRPDERIDCFPHQLSGGQRQRVMVAIAIACEPKLLIADEPTTALDVTVQKEILGLLRDLQEQTGMAVVLISHDLGVVAETCDFVAIMYRGKIVETGRAEDVFSSVAHPYTRGLLNSIPPVDRDVEVLNEIPGRVPSIEQNVPGCSFHSRCTIAAGICREIDPEFSTVSGKHEVRCHFALGSNNRAV